MKHPADQSAQKDTSVPSPFSHFHPVSGMKNFFSRMIGAPVESRLGEYWKMVEKVNCMDVSGKTDSQLAERTRRIERVLLKDGMEIPPPELEIEVFGLVREASRRTVRLDPFDVQMIAGMAMARGTVAELPTGEGKTLAAVFTACLRALSGRGVHVLTFNDYLARRDADWMGPIYHILGLSVGCVQEGMTPQDKRAAYSCDVTYAAAKEAGFDFLRDQIAYDRHALVHRSFNFALVDEADSILIDEARIPLVISGAEDRASWDTNRLSSIVQELIPDRDFETDDEHRNVFLTDAGIERVESTLGCGSLYIAENQSLLEAVYCALHAQALLQRDVDYIVRGGRIEIVDEYTGRVVEKRHWPDGLQAAVEAKEGLSRKTQGRILGSITLQHYFRLYPAIGGMTATAQSGADEFYEFYGMKVTVIPPHRASVRVDHPDVIFTHRAAKVHAVVKEIVDAHALGRPVLVGTASVKESEELAAELRSAGICCAVLNAKNDELEAGIIAKAGMLGAVTISTNMAGRGVDIKLGGNDEVHRDAVVALGGLYVIGTNRNESLRIDRQLKGRAGRQGDPGASRLFISFEDDLFERYGLTRMLMAKHRISRQEAPLQSSALRREIAHAQRIIEGQNFDIRRSLCKYSSLLDLQRQIIQARREESLLGTGEPDAAKHKDSSSRIACDAICQALPEPMQTAGSSSAFSLRRPVLYGEGVRRFGPDKMAELERRATLFHLDRIWSDHLAWLQDARDSIHLVNLGGREPIDEFTKWATEEFLKMENRIDEAVIAEMTAIVQKEGPIDLDLERLKGPSSTWTYLVNEDQFGSGVEMAKGKNIGFVKMAFSAPLFTGPLLMLTMILGRRSRRKQKV